MAGTGACSEQETQPSSLAPRSRGGRPLRAQARPWKARREPGEGRARTLTGARGAGGGRHRPPHAKAIRAQARAARAGTPLLSAPPTSAHALQRPAKLGLKRSRPHQLCDLPLRASGSLSVSGTAAHLTGVVGEGTRPKSHTPNARQAVGARGKRRRALLPARPTPACIQYAPGGSSP